MTNRKRVSFKIEGPDKNNHHLELSVFVEKTKQFLDLLKTSAKDSGEDNAVFHVVRLSHSSPATIECERAGQDALPDIAAFNDIVRNLNFVEDRQTRNLSHPVLSAMEKLAQFSSKKIAWAEIQTISSDADEERVYKLDGRFRNNLREARHAEEKVISTIDGKLEQINIHNNANTFRIYTTLPHMPSVACKFPKELIGKVQDALGAFVSVWGECIYRPDAAFPYKIDVREMTPLPPSEELPSLRDLFGIAPDATGDKTSEQFVRELRDAWSKDIQ